MRGHHPLHHLVVDARAPPQVERDQVGAAVNERRHIGDLPAVEERERAQRGAARERGDGAIADGHAVGEVVPTLPTKRNFAK